MPLMCSGVFDGFPMVVTFSRRHGVGVAVAFSQKIKKYAQLLLIQPLFLG